MTLLSGFFFLFLTKKLNKMSSKTKYEANIAIKNIAEFNPLRIESVYTLRIYKITIGLFNDKKELLHEQVIQRIPYELDTSMLSDNTLKLLKKCEE